MDVIHESFRQMNTQTANRFIGGSVSGQIDLSIQWIKRWSIILQCKTDFAEVIRAFAFETDGHRAYVTQLQIAVGGYIDKQFLQDQFERKLLGRGELLTGPPVLQFLLHKRKAICLGE